MDKHELLTQFNILVEFANQGIDAQYIDLFVEPCHDDPSSLEEDKKQFEKDTKDLPEVMKLIKNILTATHENLTIRL